MHHFSESIRIDPENALAYRHAGIVLAQGGKLSEAHAFLQKAAQLNPRLPDVWRQLRKVRQALADREMQSKPPTD